jgi:hypothetical protein
MATWACARPPGFGAHRRGAAGAGLFVLFGMGPVYLAITGFYALRFLLTWAWPAGNGSMPDYRPAVAVARSG